MGRNTGRHEENTNFNTDNSLNSINKILIDKEFSQLKTLIKSLSIKYNISKEKITDIAQNEEDIVIPTSIFSDEKLSMLETSVKYLKDDLNLKFSSIGKILNRDERTIWTTYHNSCKKSNSKLLVAEGISLPIKVLSDRRHSILEQAVGYLKETHSMKFSEIARLLKLDDRTIWTCYNRLKKKREGENEAR